MPPEPLSPRPQATPPPQPFPAAARPGPEVARPRRPDAAALRERVAAVFAGGVHAETALGLAARLCADERATLAALLGLVAEGRLLTIEERALLVFLTPAYAGLLTAGGGAWVTAR